MDDELCVGQKGCVLLSSATNEKKKHKEHEHNNASVTPKRNILFRMHPPCRQHSRGSMPPLASVLGAIIHGYPNRGVRSQVVEQAACSAAASVYKFGRTISKGVLHGLHRRERRRNVGEVLGVLSSLSGLPAGSSLTARCLRWRPQWPRVPPSASGRSGTPFPARTVLSRIVFGCSLHASG
jgi:hypothetical protein